MKNAETLGIASFAVLWRPAFYVFIFKLDTVMAVKVGRVWALGGWAYSSEQRHPILIASSGPAKKARGDSDWLLHLQHSRSGKLNRILSYLCLGSRLREHASLLPSLVILHFDDCAPDSAESPFREIDVDTPLRRFCPQFIQHGSDRIFRGRSSFFLPHIPFKYPLARTKLQSRFHR